MANAVTEPDVGSQLVVPAGLMYFDEWNTDNEKTGAIHLGESEAFTIAISGDTLTRNTRTTAARDLIKQLQTNVTRVATISTLSIIDDTIRLFLTATESTVTQTASAVANEEHKYIQTGRIYRFGATTSNPVGIQGAASVSVTNHDATKAAWAGATAYAVGDNVEKVSDDGTVFRCKVAHTSHASTEPTWVTTTVADFDTAGSLTADAGGTADVWEYIAAANTTFTVVTDYELDDTAATGARIRWVSATQPRYIYVNYTPTANSRTRHATSDTIRKTGELIVVTANQGTDSVYVMPKVELSASGDLDLINDGSAFQILTFEAGILKSGSLSAIYRDGIAV